MSYDLRLEVDTGGPEPIQVIYLDPTYNLGPMFRLALKAKEDEGSFEMLEGKDGYTIIPLLEAAVSHMTHPNNVATYKALNPSNGWGDYDGAVETLQTLLDYARKHPKAVFHYH